MSEIEEHFRNICETFSPTVENNGGSPKFSGSGGTQADHDLSLCDIAEAPAEENAVAKPIKKLKIRPTPNLLSTMGRQMSPMARQMSPMANTEIAS